MRVSIVSSLLLFICSFSIFQPPAFALRESYIVYLGSYQNHLEDRAADHDRAVLYHQEILGSCLGSIKKAKSSIFYSYNRYINGFAAILAEEDVQKVKNHPKVISVFEDRGRKVQTTNSWSHLGLENGNDIPLDSAWKKGRFGEDVIIGNLDSGAWPESKSFSDEGMGPVPQRWRGSCQTRPKDGFKCNRKLIGARFYNRAYLREARKIFRRQNMTYVATHRMITPRDYDGHGTHTLSTAAGNIVPNVSAFGHGNGTAKGGSPRARVAAYKVCWDSINGGGSCFDSDVMAAFEAAISDGVDIISVSAGSAAMEYFFYGFAIGSFHATRNGILVVASAGNSGPGPSTVEQVSPWILTVGASTTNREFVNYVTLGNNKTIRGASLSDKGMEPQKFLPLISGASAKYPDQSNELAEICMLGAFDPKLVKGKVLLCLRHIRVTTDLSSWANDAGAVGLIIVNDEKLGNDVMADSHILPTSIISFEDSKLITDYMKSTQNPVAHISEVKTEFDKNPSTAMAAFSSRGPNPIDPAILKPDVTAPGSEIIAAFSPATSPTKFPNDTRSVSYLAMSGTSMSCPHVSGIAGLVKTAHPDWSPAAIKSAIMTTSSPIDKRGHPILDFNNLEATPFAYGAGQVNPNSALDPGLVYDLNPENYLNYLCSRGYNDSVLRAFTISDKPYSCPASFKMGDFNYPSISVPSLNSTVRHARFLKNVGSPGTYNVSVKAPAGVSISVEPSSLKFEKYRDEKKFEIIFTPKGDNSPKGYGFGEIIWSDGLHNVRSPVVVNL